MTTYITPFSIESLQAVAPSADSGFTSLNEAIAAMTPLEPIRVSGRMAVFHASQMDGLFFSDYAVCAPPKQKD